MPTPPVLFLSPVPADGLNSGLRIRGQRLLKALQQTHRVHALHLNTGWRWDSCALPCFPLADPGLVWRRALHCLRPTTWVSEHRYFSRLAQREILARWRRYGYTRVHLFRAAMLPFVAPLMQLSGVRVDLDLDELESVTRSGLARLARRRGDFLRAQTYEREAAHFAELEKRWLPRMTTITLASVAEKERLQAYLPGLNLEVVPNLPRTIPAQPTSLEPHSRDLLFVGNLDYYPNRDAVDWLCSEVVPRLRTRASDWRLLVAGSGRFRPPAGHEVVDLGCVGDLEPYYRKARAALVPIRAGGGTRIKALEAFAYCRTIIATPFGVEGLAIEDGRHGFLAETADHFADQCALLLSRPDLGREAGLRAYQWLCELAGHIDLVRQLS